MMARVTAKQLLVRASEAGQRSLSAIDSRVDADVWDYEDLDGGVTAPQLGTAGLLHLAVALSARGYSITELDLRNERFQSLEESVESSLIAFLKPRIRAGNIDDSLIEQLIASNGLVAVSISARLPGTATTMVINRDGQIRARESDAWDQLVADVGAALGYE